MLFESQNVVFAPPAQVAELADALASGASVRKDVGVQVPPWAHVMETSHFKVWGFRISRLSTPTCRHLCSIGSKPVNLHENLGCRFYCICNRVAPPTPENRGARGFSCCQFSSILTLTGVIYRNTIVSLIEYLS